MTLDQFTKMPVDEQTNYLWDNGICLGQRMFQNQYIVCIFSIDNFFVEARYSKNNNGVDAILPLRDVLEWEAYVDRNLRQLIYLS